MANKVETYKVEWWGCPGSIMGRPIYRILDVRNGEYMARFGSLAGRIMGNYVLPYWPITSFLSMVTPPAELAHQSSVVYTEGGETETLLLRTGDAIQSHYRADDEPDWVRFQVANPDGWTVLKITNDGSKSPLQMEHYALIPEGLPFIGMTSRVVNLDMLRSNVRGISTYEQFFNWDEFGTGAGDKYAPAAESGGGDAFYAMSRTMERGFEFLPMDNCTLSFELDVGSNGWRVDLSCPGIDLDAGEESTFSYQIRLLQDTPGSVVEPVEMPDPIGLGYSSILPRDIRSTVVEPYSPTSIRDVIDRLDAPKVRGLNLKATYPDSLDDLDILSKWGCNMIIWYLDHPDHVRRMCGKAHSLGMEALLQGSGGFLNPPSFEPLKGVEFGEGETPDSFGQDEDHYYWHPLKSLDGFRERFGKDPSLATLEEKATHLSSLFADKWRGVLEDARTINDEAGIWFYTPSPIVVNVDPLDKHEAFIGEVKKLGTDLTVFPFYYGVDYGQVEYMVRSWKRDNPGRVVFLPMRDFMARPSQFIRAITAARRAGADGVCGFSFAVGESDPGQEWQWKSVMLGSWANFPTPELDAICCIEDSAGLLEQLSRSEVLIAGEEKLAEDLASRIDGFIPRGVASQSKKSRKAEKGQLIIEIGTEGCENDPSRGLLAMDGRVVRIDGNRRDGIGRAISLFTKFAELVPYEH
jgi:hypothetical protein